MSKVTTRVLIGISAILVMATAGIAATQAAEKRADSMARCSEMMQGTGDGDPRLGMTRMMEMMGSMGGGMKGGPSGTMRPGGWESEVAP